MTEQGNSAGILIDQAKKAILAGDIVFARQLADQALKISPDNSDARLILAGLSDPETSFSLLHSVLESDPKNPYVHKAISWAGSRTRQETAAQWVPAVLPEVPTTGQPVQKAEVVSQRKKRPAWAIFGLSLLVLLIVFALYSV